MLSIALLFLACDTDVSQKQGVQEYDDASDIPTPSEEAEEVVPDDTEDIATGPVTYDFDDTDSLIYVQVFKDKEAWGSDLAHNHVIRASGWTGSVVLDLDNPADCSLSFVVPIELLSVDEDGMRDLVGYGDTISSSDRAEIRDHMLSNDQLNVSRYSDITFEGSSCTISGDEQIFFDGQLTVAGGTGRFDLAMDMVISDGRLYLKGNIDASHDDFGFSPFSAYGGFVRNSDPLPFTIDVVGTPRP